MLLINKGRTNFLIFFININTLKFLTNILIYSKKFKLYIIINNKTRCMQK